MVKRTLRRRPDTLSKREKKKEDVPVEAPQNERQSFDVDDHTCKFCLNYYTRKDQLAVHLKKCSKANSKAVLERGMKRDSERKILCEVCGNSFTSREALRKHILTHSDGSNYHCPSCDKSYSLYHNLIRHIKAEDHIYPKGDANLTTSFKSPHMSKCDICDNWVGRMEYHKKKHHSESSRLFECQKCDYKTNRKDNFERHEFLKHKRVAKAFKQIDITFKNEKPNWKCPECDVIFTSYLDIENHLLLKNCQEIVCKICDRKFKMRQHLLQHFRNIHENPQTFKCPKCSRSYAHKSSLTKHLKVCK